MTWLAQANFAVKKNPAFYALQEAQSKLNKNISSNIERYPERR
jgi:hypothetical protein